MTCEAKANIGISRNKAQGEGAVKNPDLAAASKALSK